MLASFKAWLDQPFSPGQDALHWFLFFGLIIVIATAWRVILSHLEIG